MNLVIKFSVLQMLRNGRLPVRYLIKINSPCELVSYIDNFAYIRSSSSCFCWSDKIVGIILYLAKCADH